MSAVAVTLFDMDGIVALILGLLVGIALGAAGGWLFARTRQPAASGVDYAELAHAQAQRAAAEATSTQLRDQLARDRELHEQLVAEMRHDTQERLAQQEAQYRAQIRQQDEHLAELRDRLAAMKEAETERAKSEGKVLTALSPVQESLRLVQSKVMELEEQRQKQHGELSTQLRSALESEERLRQTAETLASALRSNSTRGVWGETQLRSVVEAAGLIERVNFDVQTNISTDSGVGRPDMVIHLPGGKHIAVDAKVPFDAYLEASAIPASSTGVDAEHRAGLMKRHVKAMRDHISALGTKGYWNGLANSPELVIAFIPSEPLLSSALEADPSLMEFAFAKRVALASPFTLLSVLKTVALSWQHDVLTHEAQQVFELSRDLYTRLGTTAKHIDKLGNTIGRSVKDYNQFIASFESRVFPTARKLAALNGENLFAPIDTIEETPRPLSGHELVQALDASRYDSDVLDAEASKDDPLAIVVLDTNNDDEEPDLHPEDATNLQFDLFTPGEAADRR